MLKKDSSPPRASEEIIAPKSSLENEEKDVELSEEELNTQLGEIKD